MTDDVVAEQVDYYRRRAHEYDATAYGDLTAARERIARLVGRMRIGPRQRVVEIACGTGLWTEALAGAAGTVLAIDTAPEAIAIARGRIASPNVAFEVADVFAWSTPDRFDVVFFSAWLSHVPADRFERFWRLLRGLLAEHGRVLFVDEHVDERWKEVYLPGADEIVERRMQDGRTYRVVKNFIDPEALQARLRDLGWECSVQRDGGDWILGEARPAQARLR